MKTDPDPIHPRSLDPMRARQIDFALARVRQAIVTAEIEAGHCPGLSEGYKQTGLAFNALWVAAKNRNANAAQAAAVLVAAAAAGLAAGALREDGGRVA